MNRYDSVSSLIWFLVGLCIILWSSLTLKFGTLKHPGPGFLPISCGVVILILATIVFSQTKMRAKGATEEKFYTRGSIINVCATIGILILYASMLEALGFILTTFVVMLFIFKTIAGASWFIGIIESSITTGTCYYVFGVLLKVSLPRGLLGI